MGRFVKGADRWQRSFLPECLEDWVDEDNAVRRLLNLLPDDDQGRPA